MQTLSPARDDYATRCHQLVRILDDGTPLYVELHSDGRRFRMVLVNVDDLGCHGGHPTVEGHDYTFVAVIGDGAYWFDTTSYCAPRYVAEKLNLELEDGTLVAEFLTRLGAARRVQAA